LLVELFELNFLSHHGKKKSYNQKLQKEELNDL
jgi:hypothetical protein